MKIPGGIGLEKALIFIVLVIVAQIIKANYVDPRMKTAGYTA